MLLFKFVNSSNVPCNIGSNRTSRNSSNYRIFVEPRRRGNKRTGSDDTSIGNFYVLHDKDLLTQPNMFSDFHARLGFIQNLPRTNIVNCMSVIYPNHNPNSEDSLLPNRNFEVRFTSSKYFRIVKCDSLTYFNIDIFCIYINVGVSAICPFVDHQRTGITNAESQLISLECFMNLNSIINTMKHNLNARNFLYEFLRSIL